MKKLKDTIPRDDNNELGSVLLGWDGRNYRVLRCDSEGRLLVKTDSVIVMDVSEADNTIEPSYKLPDTPNVYPEDIPDIEPIVETTEEVIEVPKIEYSEEVFMPPKVTPSASSIITFAIVILVIGIFFLNFI